MRIPLVIIALLVALPRASYAADVLINNGLDCSNPGNVINHTIYQNDNVYVRNAGCGTPDPGSPCPSPGAATEVCLVDGGEARYLYAYDSSAVTITGGTVRSDLWAYGSSTIAMSGGDVLNSLNGTDSTTITISGGHVHGLSFSGSTLTMDAGEVYDLYLWAFSSVTVRGGTVVHRLVANGSATITMSGGTVGDRVIAADSSTVTLSGGAVLNASPSSGVYAGHSSTVTIDGVTAYELHAYDSSTVTMTGGTLELDLHAHDLSTITIAGCDFAVDGSPVPYGDLNAQTGTLTGKLPSGDPIDNVFYQGGWTEYPCNLLPCTGAIRLVEGRLFPALSLSGKLGLGAALLGAGLLGVGVMRRRAA